MYTWLDLHHQDARELMERAGTDRARRVAARRPRTSSIYRPTRREEHR
ncbi:hypothetical protein [Georgenia sp. H159]|nr:hypothetical protein [Georgenia sp. H159]